METSFPNPPPVLPPDTKSPTTVTTTPLPTPSLPPITTSTSQSYITRAANICARASLADPFSNLLSHERRLATPNPPPTITLTDRINNNTTRFTQKIAQGADIVESGCFAAVACWEPPSTTAYGASEIWDADAVIGAGIPYIDQRPIFKSFLTEIAAAKRRLFSKDQAYWHLSLMARDPERHDRGAVRAIIEPLVERARQERVPVWLEAGNERARDVYEWVGGFRVVGEVWSAEGRVDRNGREREGGEWVVTYLMVANWPVEEVKG